MKCFVILFVLRLWTFSRKFQFIQQVLVYTRSSNDGINFFSVVFFTLYTYQKILSYDLHAVTFLLVPFIHTMKGLIVVVFFLIHLAIIASTFVSLVGLCKQCNDSKYLCLPNYLTCFPITTNAR